MSRASPDGSRPYTAHVRVRTIRLRLLASVATLLWGAAAAAVLVGYRPGVLVAPLVAATPIMGMLASLAALAWPPLVRGRRASAVVAWIGILELLLLAPSLAGLVSALRQPGTSPFLPSGEDAYAWFVTLAAASLFAGIGLSRRVLGGMALRRARLSLAGLIAVSMIAVGSGISGVAALGTEVAYSSGGAGAPGPSPASLPPTCSAGLIPAEDAEVTIAAMAQTDGHDIGSVELSGVRAGSLEHWSANLSGWPVDPGGEPPALEYARTASGAWLRSGDGNWTSAPLQERITPYVPIGATPAPVIVQDRETLDSEVIRVALSGSARLAAEDVGIEIVDGEAARHCRLLAGGSIALQAFRPLRWLLGESPLSDESAIADWRGNLDWWVLDDGTLAMAEVSVEGLTPGGWPAGLQATLRAALTVHALSRPPVIPVPLP